MLETKMSHTVNANKQAVIDRNRYKRIVKSMQRKLSRVDNNSENTKSLHMLKSELKSFKHAIR